MTLFWKVAYTNIYDGFGAKEIALSYEVVLRNASGDPYERIQVYEKTKMGRSFSADGTSFKYRPFFSLFLSILFLFPLL